MTSRELEYIKTVADEKSISSAARKLYIAQPSLSQSLQRIEENLGAKLFNRTPSGLTLTYAGERCYQMACQVLKIYSDFEAEISDINQLKTGRIVMGTTNHLGTVILPEILLEFKENSPSVELEILEDNTGNLEAKLLTGAMDFALLHAPKLAPNPLLNYEFLSEDPFVIALAAGHPLIEKAQKKPGYLFPVLDVRLLKNEPLILLHSQQRIRFFLLQPALQRFEALEDRRPRRVLLFMMIDREADSRGMRDGDTAENVSHQITPLIGVRGGMTKRQVLPL